MQAIEWQYESRPVSYEEAVAAMERRVAAVAAGETAELVWLLEHPALYTAGTSAKESDLLDPARLPVFKTGRGGQYTYHGPGQRIAYVMLDLKRRAADGVPDLRAYVQSLEGWIIAVLAALGVEGFTRDGRIGVWVDTQAGEQKIAAIGIRVRRGVSYHGIALNICPDLAHYRGIIPCGISEHGVTSLEALGIACTMAEVDKLMHQHFPYA